MTKRITSKLETKLLDLITDISDYPKPGIVFKDITPLLGSPLFSEVIATLADQIRDLDIEMIAGIESRGFILGAALAHELNVGFVPVRKSGKLPPPVVSLTYKLEYGEDTVEVKAGRGRVVVVDDILATGGTLTAAANVLKEAGYDIQGFCVLMNLQFLNQFGWHGLEARSLINIRN
jgi:adenine phosphoribosyltransferase